MFHKCFLPLVLLFLLTTSHAQDTVNEDYQAQANQLLEDAIANNQYAGLTAGFSINGEAKWLGSAGFCDEDRSVPCQTETINRIASVTKTMTAVAALQLVEAGKLDLDAFIETYLPDYPQPAAGTITVRMLLHHTSGIGGYESGKETETKVQYNTLQEACVVFQDRELLFEPGTKYSYTTYGYVVLGAVIEVAAEQEFGAYLQENIWDKVEMRHTGIEQFGQVYPGKSALFSRRKKGKIKTAEANNLSNRVPGGGVYSTAGDLLRFGQGILDGTLISAESFAILQTTPDVERGENNPYGMGIWVYGENPDFGIVMGHTGEQTGCSSMFIMLPETGIVVAVLSNTSHSLREAFKLAVQLYYLAGEAFL